MVLACAATRGMAQSAASAPIPPAAASAATGPAAGHDHVARQRRAHLTRLQERIDKSVETLHQSCRFESEIATPPPHQLVALTFDDGPEPVLTDHILDVLTRHEVPATFFVIGEKAARHPELVQRMRELPGGRVGNHSWSHPNFHDIGVVTQDEEIDRADNLLAAMQAPDPKRDKLFRYPYGNSSCEANDHVRAAGYRIVGWHVDSCDWAFDGDGKVDAHEALSCGVMPPFRHDFLGHVTASVRAYRGGIVLLHEIHHNTVHQLEELIVRLKADGFVFTTPDDPAFFRSLR
jgi:peptidoglycan/xylan/chitin deacetylase (PgdA/CDA1 family)